VTQPIAEANGTLFVSGSDYPATGSGLIDSFVRIQAKDFEEGYNTDFRPQQFDEGSTATFNHSILADDVPVIEIGSDKYWEFRLDLNEHDNNADRDRIFLESLRLFAAGVANLTGFDPENNTFGTPGAELLYDLDDGNDISVQLSEWTSGSGHGDYTVLIPYPEFAGEGEFEGQYLYLYSSFSETDGGFEEWYLRKFGLLENTATVTSAQGATDSDTATVVVSAEANYEINSLAVSVAGENVIEYTVTIRNDGNVTLGNVSLTDQLEGGSPVVLDNSNASGDNGNGKLDLGESWTYSYTRHFGQDGSDLNGDLMLASTVMVDSDETHPLSSSTEVDITSMIFTGMALQGHEPGWWASHKVAWDGNQSTNTWDSLVGSELSMKDVLIAVDSNGNGSINASDAKGLLIGDVNANGLADAGETTLFVPLAAAQQIIAASDTSADLRQVLMKEALAAQLNINNMSGDSTLDLSDAEGPKDIVSEAAMWLRGLVPYTYGANSTGRVDTNGNGSLLSGTSSSSEYNTSTKAFTSDANGSASGKNLTSTLSAWSLDVDVDGLLGDVMANGQDLKNGLKAFNAGQLVVSQSGVHVGWFDGTVFVDVVPNTPEAFWNMLSGHAPQQ
jgi:uncharacterized repeat protein (TIGR01451 family)